MVRRALLLCTACLLLFAAGCGDKEEVTHEATTEGIWLDIGNLDYHVQASRLLNPYEVPDDRYLDGLPANYAQPTKSEAWFAVFLRIENRSKTDGMTATKFEIEDTLGNKYTPVALNTQINPFAYKAAPLGPEESMPHPDSTQETDSVAGSELLFKLPLTNYQDRPLQFRITGPDGTVAMLDLDV
jgi:Zn-finger nucleic acid-binding protein